MLQKFYPLNGKKTKSIYPISKSSLLVKSRGVCYTFVRLGIAMFWRICGGLLSDTQEK